MDNQQILDGGKKKSGSKKPSKSGSKKGGSLASEVQKLAVPFAILLAKEGLDAATKKSKKSAKEISAKVPSKKGGDCGSSCKKSGGEVKNRFEKLSQDIDNFLKKY